MRTFTSLLVAALTVLSLGEARSQTCSMYVGGYVTYYRNASASNIDYTKTTDLFYAFAGSDSAGNIVVMTSPDVPVGNLDTFTNATVGKNRYLSLEGGNSHSVRDMATSATARAAFITNCVNFCTARSFTGIDLDWENIQNTTDQANFDSLVSGLATSLHSHGFKLVLTLNYGSYNAGYYDLPTVQKADFIQVMAYDQLGYGSSSPFGNPSTYQNVLDAVAYWQGRGYTNLANIVIGVPFYGNTFPSTSGGYAPSVTYASIINANPNLKADQDQVGLTFLNSAATIRKKMEYVKFTGLKGIMIWELGQDLPSTNTKSLLRAVSDAACDQNPFWSDYSVSCTNNVAVNKHVDVSSYSSNAVRITDNNLATVWSGAVTDTEWVSVDLGAFYDICTVEIDWDQTGIGRDFQIKTSPDNTTWTVVDQRFYNSSMTSIINGLSTSTRWVGFQGVTRPCNSRYKIAEMRVYGTLSATQPGSSAAPVKKMQAGSATLNASASGLKVYPNPAHSQFVVDMSGLDAGSQVKSLELLDGLGRRVRQIQVGAYSATQTIDTGHLPAGMYVLRAVMDHKPPYVQKLLVQH